MIYLDNSATSYPKPQGVRQAVQRAMVEDGANPGRSSLWHVLSHHAGFVWGTPAGGGLFWGGGARVCGFPTQLHPSAERSAQGVLEAGGSCGGLGPGAQRRHAALRGPEGPGNYLHPGPDRPRGQRRHPGRLPQGHWPQNQAGGVHHGLQCVWRPPAGGAHHRPGPPVRGQGLRGRRPGGGAGSHQPGGERHQLPVLRRAQGTVRPHGHGPAGAPPAGRAPSHPGGGGDGHPVPQPGDAC